MRRSIYFQEIDLLPSLWKLDVWVGGTSKDLAVLFNKRYGASVEYYNEEYHPDRCMTVSSTNDSELKGRTQIVVQLYSFDVGVVLHEINHAVWHFSKASGVEINHDSQEWQTLMLEYLFEKARHRKNYLKIESTKNENSI